MMMMEREVSGEDEVLSSSSIHHHLNQSSGVEEGASTRGVVVRQPKPFVNRRLLLILGIFVIIVLAAILISLVCHWLFSMLRHGHPYLKYNYERMTSLQPKLIGKVRGLWDMVNRSVHEGDARDYLRNLSRTDRSTCYSALCVHTALNVLESMDFSVDPCEDFYSFTCGGWMRRNPPELPSSVTDHFAKINDRVIIATQRIIAKNVSTSTRSPNDSNKGLRLAKSFYYQCTDIEQLERDGLDPILNILETHGGWPLLNGYAPNDTWTQRWSFNWIKVVAILQRLSIPTLLSIEIKQDTAKPQSNALFVVEPMFFLSKEYLITPEKSIRLLTAYKQFIVDVAHELLRWKAQKLPGLVVQNLRLEDMAENIITLEVGLAKLVTPERTIANIETYWEVQQLQDETDKQWTNSNPQNKLIWKDFLDLVFEGSEVNITTHEKILIHDLPYVHGLVKLLDKTPTETVANYILWRLMVKFTTGSTKTLRKIHAKFYQDLYGEQKLMDRNSTCSMVINTKFAIAVGAEFVKDSFESSLKREVETLAANVKVRMEELLGRQSFIPHILQLAIRRKLASIKLCVGYPRSFSNSTYVADFYEDLVILENATYIEKYMSITTWLFLKSLPVLRHPFDTECWGGNYWSFIGEAYAYYDTARNSINLPVGLLQSPFYYQRPTVPSYLNYGGIGTIIGHELTHSLNIEGWIRVKLVKELETLWECLISSYSETDIPELEGKSKVDGYRTRSENFADHFGLASAFWAYQQHINSIKTPIYEEEHNLPGLELFSNAQMFFVSFSNV
ncbi:unnamed protein product [Orchesella dallaii]|uniref:Endothelin-converting enzyme 1 n=1 Tax=Orchesella dallaii TaxID=48710 RepID=A0ABP1PWQ7_9HEXA